MARKSKTAFLDELMAEHVELAGCPDIVLTRHDAWRFYADRCGLPKFGGFASADFLAMGRKAVDAPLTDLSEPWTQRIMEAIANG